MHNLCTALLVLLFAASLPAQDKPTPDTPEQAADKVLAAFKAEDQKALKSLAEKDEPDPWLVADQLCARGEHEAAEAFGGAAPRMDMQKLPEYARSRFGAVDAPSTREARRMARDKRLSRNPGAAMKILENCTGDPSPVVAALLEKERAYCLRDLKRFKESVASFERAADLAEAIGWWRAVAFSSDTAGQTAFNCSDLKAAARAWNRHLAVERKREREKQVGRALQNLGVVRVKVGDLQRACELFEQAIVMHEKHGARKEAAQVLGNQGAIHFFLGEHEKALDCQRRSLALNREIGNRLGEATALGNIGTILATRSRDREALDHLDRSIEIFMTLDSIDSRRGLGNNLANAGRLQLKLGRDEEALRRFEEALAIHRAMGSREGVARDLGNIGRVHLTRGEWARARSRYGEALEIFRETGVSRGIQFALSCLGELEEWAGNFARALTFLEEARDLEAKMARTGGRVSQLQNTLASVYTHLGDHERARRLLDSALEACRKQKDPSSEAKTLEQIACILSDRKDYEGALDHRLASLAIWKQLGYADEIAVGHTNLGVLFARQGRFDESLDHLRRAMEIHGESGNPMRQAEVLTTMASVENERHRPREALALLDQMESLEGAASAPLWRFMEVVQRARALLELERPEEAVAALREVMRIVPRVLGGLPDELGARGREFFSLAWRLGAKAALALDDPAEAVFFLESGRAGALQEMLRARETLQETVLPQEYRRAELRARTKERVAAREHEDALKGGDRKALRAARDRLAAARQERAKVLERIQMEAKAAADIVYPKADDLEVLQGHLAKNQALVLYGIRSGLAAVVTPAGARIVPLPEKETIEAALEGFRKGEDGLVDGAAALRAALAKPLGLKEGVRRVLLSVDESLSDLPPALLFPGHEVACIPSGTTYGILLEDRGRRGEGVLALGDPDYRAAQDPPLMARRRGGRRLLPLPGSKAEAEALGTVTLLGKKATESGLRAALARKERWRAVHLACHGLIDSERPMLSSLAITADEKDDGFLSVMDVFRMKVPADLVVLSACETGRGKVVKGEGILGLTRAFMFAGAPRVIVSLWKVDDEATKALMVKFYGLWNPKDRSKGLPTATALKKAQEFVASQEQWKHPHYWAAWQLWGLPD